MMGGEFGEPANGEWVRAAGRQGPGVGAARKEKADSGSFAYKPLISLETAKEKVWKSLEKAWKKLGNPWKSLETLGIPGKTLRAGRRRVGRGGGLARPCAQGAHSPDKAREVGEGRTARQPGQVRKEAALTSQGGSLSNLLPANPPFRLCPALRAAAAASGQRTRAFGAWMK